MAYPFEMWPNSLQESIRVAMTCFTRWYGGVFAVGAVVSGMVER